jgi:predicted house-cleaning noncanonical NTP pyrophosphatase (MazG superfamily)
MESSKLIRDRIPEIVEKKGEKIITHIAGEQEYQEALESKLYEEVDEFLKDPSIGEAADVLEVLYTICALKGIDLEMLEEVRKKKLKERGGFEERIMLDKDT